MNDEVKLILTKLKIVSEEKENGAYICDKKHSKLLLSYIEQLEKEIERQSKLQVIQDDKITEANDSITWWQNRYNAIVNQNDDNHKKVVKLENNRDKAIEYVEEKGRLKYNPNELINILKGDSDE